MGCLSSARILVATLIVGAVGAPGVPVASAADAIPSQCAPTIGQSHIESRSYHGSNSDGLNGVTCFYLNSQFEWSLDGGWTVAADPDAVYQHPGFCKDHHSPGTLYSPTRSAYVTYQFAIDAGIDPNLAKEAAQELLPKIARLAQSCDGAPPATEPPTSIEEATTSTTEPVDRKELCPEATKLAEAFGNDRLAASGIDPMHTGLRVDGADLNHDIQAALRRYNHAHADDEAYVSDGTPFAGEAGALNWLFGYGGAIRSLGKYYVTGTENELRARVIAAARAQGTDDKPSRLTPGDVLELSLELNHGHLNQALLAAHNMLRTSARNDIDSSPSGVLADSGALIDTYLVPLRDNGENGGPWYHMFGTAYYEVVARGDWGPWLATGAAIAAWGTGMIATGGAALPLGAAALTAVWQGTSATGTTGAARVANGMEQFVREHGFGDRAANRPDPEKFCFNVWGAQIGAKLYKQLPYKSTRSLHNLRSSLPPPEASPWIDPLPRLGAPRYVNAIGSPFSVWWSEGTTQMLLDQGRSVGEAQLIGGVPGFVMPIQEDDSWGVVWTDPQTDGQLVAVEAATAGAVLHLVRVDTQTGKTAIYETTARRAGQQFSIDLDPATLAPPLNRQDGVVIRPRIVQLDLAKLDARENPPPTTPSSFATRAKSAAGATPPPSRGSLWLPLAIAIVAAVLTAGAATWTVIRRRRRRESRADALA